jgi:O-antigen ligase
MESEREQIRNNYIERHELNFFWQHAHNDYLEWLIELGVVGTLILFSIPGYFFWIIFKSKLWKDPVPLMLLTGLGSTMVHGLIDFPFRNPAVLVTWLALLAVIARLCEPKGTK